MIISSEDIKKLLETPFTQVAPSKLKEALEYAFDYIQICENNGATTFDDFALMRHGIFPPEYALMEMELKKKKEATEGESEASSEVAEDQPSP